MAHNEDIDRIRYESTVERIRKYKIIETDSHRGDVFGNYSDISKLLSLGWEPTIDIEQGINSTLSSAIEVLR
mgnify:CR=1 FL=1